MLGSVAEWLGPGVLLLLLLQSCLGQSEPDYRCLSDKDCQKFAWKGVCCVQLSCNDAYKYYRFTSGCTKQNHCEPEYKYNEQYGQFSARLGFDLWQPIRQSLGANIMLNCATVRGQAEAAVDKLPAPLPPRSLPQQQSGRSQPGSGGIANDDAAAGSLSLGRGNAFRPVKDEYCGPDQTDVCRRQGKFCCTRVTCPVDSRGAYDLEEVCVLPGGCGLKEENGRFLGRGRVQKIMWFTSEQISRRSRENFLNTVYRNKNLPLIGSCSETKTFFGWLSQQQRSTG